MQQLRVCALRLAQGGVIELKQINKEQKLFTDGKETTK
jgi:hypothetical protein